jgi:hypothetical protein
MNNWTETKYKGYFVNEDGQVMGQKGLLSLNSTHKYVQLHLYPNGIRKITYAHRLVADAFIPNPENKAEVNHINGDKKDNRVTNLQWVTRSENMKHAYDTGLVKVPIMFGKDNPAYIHGRGAGNYRGARKNRL